MKAWLDFHLDHEGLEGTSWQEKKWQGVWEGGSITRLFKHVQQSIVNTRFQRFTIFL